MNDFKNLKEMPDAATAVTFGKFDGLHIGHRKLIQKITKKAAAGLVPAVFSFDKPPGAYLAGEQTPMLLTAEEKRQLLEKMGVEMLVEYAVSKDSLSMGAEEFVTGIIRDKLHAAYIAVGEDFRFGFQRKGDISLLEAMARPCGYELEIIKKERLFGNAVSSSFIRSLLAEGKIEQVNECLGYEYSVSGRIIKGNQLGRTWQIPTINLLWPQEKFAPQFGVYFSRVEIEGRQWQGMTNIGKKPTIAGEYPAGAETYLYKCNETLYGKRAKITLLHFHRKEQKFDKMEQLISKLRSDINTGKQFFSLK